VLKAGLRQEKVLIEKFGYFLSISQQAVSANIIQNSAARILQSMRLLAV
jgi:hypothetical protein